MIISLDCLFSCLIMLNDWGWILYSFFTVLFMCFKPVVNVFAWNTFKLRNPFLDVYTLLIIVLLLGPWVENSKIWSSIRSISYSPLPASWILHRRIINQLTGKISLAFVPIQKQIFCKKRSNNHSTSIMHPTWIIKLSHCSIYNWKPSFPLFPRIQLFFIIFPFNTVKFFLEGFALQNFREIMSNVHIELSPMNFIYYIIL